MAYAPKASLILSAWLFLSPSTASSRVITPTDFGPNAQVQDFEGLALSSTFSTPVTIGSDTYHASSGVLRYEQHGDCYSGFCLGTYAPSEYIYVDFARSVNRVGVYLGGTIDASQQSLTIYDVHGTAIESWNRATQIENDLYFIGLESLDTPIQSIRLGLKYGQFSNFFDDVTVEAVPIPATPLLFASGLAALAGITNFLLRKG